MNANLKNGLIGLAMVTAASGAIYGISKSIQPKKPDIMVTDPQKAEQDIQTESDASRSIFQATQNIQNNNEVKEENPVKDISELCKDIAEYQRLNNEIINDLKSNKKADVEYKMGNAERMKQEIMKSLEEAGYKKANSPVYIDNLGNTFQQYVKRAQTEMETLK